ncbi:MAG TPA: SEC-C domain-containing protein [Eubacteriaceae bacterium]|nr:SEC-C domain-containing protein [Eubacteriaceae bacterium]
MTLFEQWRNTIQENASTQEEQEQFWDDFCDQEQKVYEKILENKRGQIEGTVKELAEEYNMEPVYFMGFLDGINDSIKEQNDLETMDEDTKVHLDIDFEKLYFNMHAVPAPWLYELEQWNNIFDENKRAEIAKAYRRSKTVVKEEKVGRNEPCPCGSGKKYKKCCGKA